MARVAYVLHEVICCPTLFVVVVVEEGALYRICLGLGHRDGRRVGHGGHGRCRQPQGRHVHVAHQPGEQEHKSIKNPGSSEILDYQKSWIIRTTKLIHF